MHKKTECRKLSHIMSYHNHHLISGWDITEWFTVARLTAVTSADLHFHFDSQAALSEL